MIDRTLRHRDKANLGREENPPKLGLVANVCAFCGRADGVPLFDVDGFTIVRCPRCRLAYTKMRPDTIEIQYDEAYYNSPTNKGGYANYFAGASINRLTFIRRLDSIRLRLGRLGRILDVGCALGDFLLAARDAGWETRGVELSPWASEFARQRHGLQVHTGTLESATFADQSFEVVTLYDVIEHIAEPIVLLREVRRILAPGGLVHIVTPNVSGFLAACMGPRWYHYKPGEHLYYFSPTTISRAFEMSELRLVDCTPIGSVLTPAYALGRLRYYNAPAARVFGAALHLARLDAVPLYLRLGELQAWGVRDR